MRRSGTDRRWADELRYLFFGCAAPAALFGILGWYNLLLLRREILGAGPAQTFASVMTGPFERGLYLAFVGITVVIYVTRPRADRHSGGVAPRAAAFVGTTMLLVFPAFFDEGPRILVLPAAVHACADVALVGCTTFGVWALLYLRHNFSIIPEARHLVRGGPYRVVRHPVYLAEIGVAVSLALYGDLHPWSTLILVPFVAVQIVRSEYEEELLRNAFPGYDPYADRTGRLVPNWHPKLT
jgi:protein-S-isoprenylcysteine O-methyltransferase Ste14